MMPIVRVPPRRRPVAAWPAYGFTLLELLAANAIGALLLVSVATVLATTGGWYSGTSRSVETTRDGRAAMEILRRDMSSLAPRSDAIRIYHRRDEGTLETLLGFFSVQPQPLVPSASDTGDLCEVLYYTAVTTDPCGNASRKLFRKFPGSGATSTLLASAPVAPLTPTPETDDAVAFNVLDFRVTFRSRDTSGTWRDVPGPDAINGTGEMLVVLRILGADAARELVTPGDWLPGGPPRQGFDFDAATDEDTCVQGFHARFHLNQ